MLAAVVAVALNLADPLPPPTQDDRIRDCLSAYLAEYPDASREELLDAWQFCIIQNPS